MTIVVHIVQGERGDELRFDALSISVGRADRQLAAARSWHLKTSL